MTPPFFSIAIPTFNRSDLLPYAVQSVLDQTFQDFEIIICDNCSADNTHDVARQFADPRVRYIKTPRHFTIADSWEFARSHVSGKLIMMLSDDDALVSSALQHFAQESRRHDADFLFSKAAEYRDQSYPGPERNTLSCPRFSATSRTLQVEDEFIRPLFSFRPKFDMHPSAFVFPKAIADYVTDRTGRFFWTNGVEYSAWPITAIFAKNLVYLDLPLTILGRTGKSWGSNIALCNPGKERIEEFIKDVDHDRKHAPLNNFTMCNLMAEGMLTAKSLFREEFKAYEFDEIQYLRKTRAELGRRQALGVDVSMEIDDLIRYSAKYPSLIREFSVRENLEGATRQATFIERTRSTIGDLGARPLRERIKAYQLHRRLTRGAAVLGFQASGEDFGFNDILKCAKFLTHHIATAQQIAQQKTVAGSAAIMADISAREEEI